MITVHKQIQSAADAIHKNIDALADQRALLSQNILSQLRNLVEGVSVFLHTNSLDSEFNYPAIEPSLSFVKSKAKFNFLGKFHKLIQQSASHYTLDGDSSERLMLKYYEYLYRIRALLQKYGQITILENLEAFPIDLDPSLREYHERIVARINFANSSQTTAKTRDRYYIHKTRPFFVAGGIYYEVTFYRAINKVSKFDRIIAFTQIDISDKYAAMLTLTQDSIEILGQTMPITIIREWEMSIRPCELENFARLLGLASTVRTNSVEYQFLMGWLTNGSGNLVDALEMTENQYKTFRKAFQELGTKLTIAPIFDEVRRIIKFGAPGQQVLRYLMLRMHNQTIKSQFSRDRCGPLSQLKLKYGCIPFDTMPFCTSLPGHNPRYSDLLECLSPIGRTHELLARCVKNNVERNGVLYTSTGDLEQFGDINNLVSIYNSKLYSTHKERRKLEIDKGHVFIRVYEDETVTIIEKLKDYASSRIDGHTQAVEHWVKERPSRVDDPAKLNALKKLFSHSRVALIYGAAGTGKSTMVDHIAQYFNEKKKLFLAHTNPAIDNLKRKVTAQNSDFSTISSYVRKRNVSQEYDLLIIDECSTVSNSDLVQVLEKTTFKLLVLVGDVYQIESIEFGNWFGLIRSFIPSTSVFELTTPYRTKNSSLLDFWNKVRNLEEDLTEVMVRNGYTTVLDQSLFEAQGKDEIILCLNYDGLYGINNINRFLQSSNRGAATTWRDTVYKIGDPILFNETERFRPVIYNNLKGKIAGIERFRDRIQFEVELDRSLSELDITSDELQWMGDSTVRFSVYTSATSDEDDDSLNTSVPFQIAYAVSIHKAQGLEYDSVKIVITDANEDEITHSIFYTAVTRARKNLRIFWTPETQQAVIKSLKRESNARDLSLLKNRRGLTAAQS